MRKIELKYGKTRIRLDYDEKRFEILGNKKPVAPFSDAQIGNKFDNPIGSKPIEEIVRQGETVLIVVPDATRATASGQIVNLLVRRLIANGTTPFDINIIFATGIHRRVTEAEKQELLTPFIARRVKTLNHNPQDLMQAAGLESKQFVNFGTIKGIPVELNRTLTEHDRVIIVGGVAFHYFAGFTGGRKLICPGLASVKTISETHRLAFDCKSKARRAGVDTGILDGNAVHEAFMEAVSKFPPAFSINTIVNSEGEAVELFCGDWISAHRAACEFYASQNAIKIAEKRNLVVASCGGFPHDVNMIQAHKALDAASRACADGGTIILLAECSDGLGRKDFLNWFEAENSQTLAEKLCENYQVNGQTAWNLLRIAERFNVQIVTALSENETRRMRMNAARDLNETLSGIDENTKGYILPFGAKFLIGGDGKLKV